MKAHVTISDGHTLVSLDGAEPIAVADLQVVPSPEVGVRPRLMLNIPADAEFDFDGVVYAVGEPDDEAVRAAAAGWIREADVDSISAIVQSRLRTLSDDPIAKTIEVIAELIGGR